MHERAHRTILRARKLVHPNIKFVKSCIRNKVKVVLDLWNYAPKKESNDATSVDTSILAAQRDFIALKAEVDKLGINKLLDAPNGLKIFLKK